MTRYHQIGNNLVPFTKKEEAAADKRQKFVQANRAIESVRNEAERRIDEGIVVKGGVRFRCDAESRSRIRDIASAPASAFPVEVRTRDGEVITFKDADAARELCDAVAAHVAGILTASAALQKSPPADPEKNKHWAKAKQKK